jgi:putative transposase
MLPHDFPPQTTVYDYFRAWRDAGVWQQLNRILREQLRMRLGRNPLPSAGIVDSQSAKTTEKGGRVDMTGRSA